MPIQSGITSWWRNRHLLFLAMLLAFAGWFGYDGFVKYPAENRAWAAQAIGAAPTDIQVNSQLTRSKADEIGKELGGRPITFEECRATLEKHVGKPSYQKGDQYWWVGPAMYIKLDPNYVSPPDSTGHTAHWLQRADAPPGSQESQILGQKWWAMGILGLAVLVALKLALVMRTKVVLDDAGLRYKSKSISWDAMTGLRSDDYARKFWVDLEYTAGDVTRSLRLDSLHIAKFKEILTAICERKGFKNPLTETKPEAQAEDGDSSPT
jgi:hypothetical protein